MTQINKAAILAQLETLLSTLDASTEATEDLLVLLKTALNADVSATDVIAELSNRISSTTTSDSIFELVYLVKSLELITQNRAILVTNVSDLLTLTNLPTGSIVFVQSENVPYVLMSSGSWETLFLTVIPANENTYAWGSNTNGRLGDDTTTSRSSPVSVVGSFADWTQTSAGQAHSLGLRANGTAWAWGAGSSGRLGDDTTNDRSSPVSVVGAFTDWVQLGAGRYHSIGLRANGTAWAWGRNLNGQLGDNTTTNRSSPVSVVGSFTDWIQVSAGYLHSLAVRANGTAWAWGYNFYGRLGDDTTTARSSPVSVIGGFTNWTHISAGSGHSLGLRADGTLWAWGYNGSGRLGDGTTTSRRSPVSVVGGFTDWTQISAGYAHNLGVRADGTLWAWGGSGSGRLGTGSSDVSSPTSVIGGFTDWVNASAGRQHSLGVRANGTAWAWGENSSGQLGDGTDTQQKNSPISVVGFSDWVSIDAGGYHSIGIRGT
jgi:alpha-tubulin suppressor-like RCC1 family protein